jgi:hypothetical protein
MFSYSQLGMRSVRQVYWLPLVMTGSRPQTPEANVSLLPAVQVIAGSPQELSAALELAVTLEAATELRATLEAATLETITEEPARDDVPAEDPAPEEPAMEDPVAPEESATPEEPATPEESAVPLEAAPEETASTEEPASVPDESSVAEESESIPEESSRVKLLIPPSGPITAACSAENVQESVRRAATERPASNARWRKEWVEWVWDMVTPGVLCEAAGSQTRVTSVLRSGNQST